MKKNLNINVGSHNYKKTELEEKIIQGLEKSYQKLIESKRKTNSEIAIIKGNKVVRIKP